LRWVEFHNPKGLSVSNSGSRQNRVWCLRYNKRRPEVPGCKRRMTPPPPPPPNSHKQKASKPPLAGPPRVRRAARCGSTSRAAWALPRARTLHDPCVPSRGLRGTLSARVRAQARGPAPAEGREATDWTPPRFPLGARHGTSCPPRPPPSRRVVVTPARIVSPSPTASSARRGQGQEGSA
jgi:hypothetical protein